MTARIVEDGQPETVKTGDWSGCCVSEHGNVVDKHLARGGDGKLHFAGFRGIEGINDLYFPCSHTSESSSSNSGTPLSFLVNTSPQYLSSRLDPLLPSSFPLDRSNGYNRVLRKFKQSKMRRRR